MGPGQRWALLDPFIAIHWFGFSIHSVLGIFLCSDRRVFSFPLQRCHIPFYGLCTIPYWWTLGWSQTTLRQSEPREMILALGTAIAMLRWPVLLTVSALPCLIPAPAIWPGQGTAALKSLSFLICKVGMLTVPASGHSEEPSSHPVSAFPGIVPIHNSSTRNTGKTKRSGSRELLWGCPWPFSLCLDAELFAFGFQGALDPTGVTDM